MVEVALGLGLIAMGMVSTVGVFPVALTAARDSIAESYAADSADHLLHALAGRMRMPNAQGQFANWDALGTSLPDAKPASAEPAVWSEWFADDTTTFSVGGASSEFYKVEQRASGAAQADFCAIYRLWRDDVTYSKYVNGQWQQMTADPDKAIAINLEVSWPSSVPYDRRQKGLFRLEVYKPQ